MTLKRVAIGSPTNVHDVYAFCRKLLDTPDDVQPITSSDDRDRTLRGGSKYIANPGGLGLNAWLWINYGADGPLTHTCDEWCDDQTHEWTESDPTQNGWAAIEVTFDTAYSYRGEGGESCSDLHARLVTALGRWLDAKGLPWKWCNEYTGEWFDRFDHLAEFGDAHRATGADDWFQNMAMPAIAGYAHLDEIPRGLK